MGSVSKNETRFQHQYEIITLPKLCVSVFRTIDEIFINEIDPNKFILSFSKWCALIVSYKTLIHVGDTIVKHLHLSKRKSQI